MEPFAHLKALHFDTILEQLKEHAISQQAKEELSQLRPILQESLCKLKMQETTSARALLDNCGTPPLSPMDSVSEHLHHAESGGMLLPGQLCEVVRFAAACKRTADYLRRGEESTPACAQVAVFGRAFDDLTALRQRIESTVSEENVYDDASPTLRNLRRQMMILRDQIKEKLNHILKSKKAYLADSYISIRGDHYVLPVLKRYKNEFGGTVIEASSKGGTLFIEPTAIRSLQEQLTALSIDEDTEVRRLLYVLSGEVADAAKSIRNNTRLMLQLDVIFAKAKYSALLRAREATLHTGRTLTIRQGRHPLLPADRCVPLNIQMDGANDGVLITGPNTGGKTLVIKTVGLFCAMAQSGLHIPCEDAVIPLHDRILCDIGDSQSISQNLSTFSGHITNVIDILNTASRDSLVLLDELGSGTDPAEGMGIALAVLQEMWIRGCRYMVTTHDPQVKEYAALTPRVIAARMAFDRESLQPLYRLEMGKTGDSCALYIAQRLGMPEGLLARVKQIVSEQGATLPPEQMKPVIPRPGSILVRQKSQSTEEVKQRFVMGDSVILMPEGENGIVYRPADDKGEMIVQVKGEKLAVNHKRVKLHIPASQLYPEDYDFSIIFDTVSNRKAAHQLNRKHDENAVIIHREGKNKED